MIGELPYSLTVGGIEYPINADFRDAFDSFEAINAKELSPLNKRLAVLEIIYGDNIPPDMDEAMRQAAWFLDGGGVAKNAKPQPKTMDYEKDAPLIFSAVNRIAGREVRDPNVECHWWTFLGYCNEISPDSPISHIVGIRNKLATGAKFEKHEQKYYNENKQQIDLTPKDSGNDDEFERALRGE